MRGVRGWLGAAAVVAALSQAAVGVLPVRGGLIVISVPMAGLAAFAVTGHIRQSRATRGRVRAGWCVAACSAGLWSLANVLYLEYAVTGHTPAEPNLAENASLLAVMLAPLALLLCGPGYGSLAVRLRRLLDVTVLAGAFFLIAWQVVLERVLAVVEPQVRDLVLLLPGFELLSGAIAVVMLSRSLAAGPNALSYLAMSMVGFATVNLGYIANLTFGHPAYASGVGFGYVMATALTAVASRAPLPPAGSLEAEQTSSRWAMLPYVPVALAFGTAAALHAFFGTLGPVEVWLLLGTACLVLVRQLLSARTNQRLLRDLTEQRAQLVHLAHHDALTGLANRTLLAERAAADLSAAAPDGVTAVVLFDLDGFKQVNDVLGHAAGDELLVATAARLRSAVRDGDTVARLGGDEFVLLLPRLAGARQAEDLAARVLAALAAPLMVGGTELSVRASAGIACAHGPDVELDRLLRDADLALYKAKADGKGRVARHAQPVA